MPGQFTEKVDSGMVDKAAHAECLGAARRGEHAVAGSGQNPLHERADGILVLGNEDDLATTRRRPTAGPRFIRIMS